MGKFIKLQPGKISIDSRFQRELDESRAKVMSKHIDPDRVGVPVVSLRRDGTMVALDGQHRITALCMAGRETTQVLCEVHEGLSLAQEAELFLKLNGGRTAVRVFDKFKARLVAGEPVAHEIQKIVHAAKLRIAKAPANNCVCAIQSLEKVHLRKGNLAETLRVLVSWSDGDPGVYDGMLIKDVSCFLAEHPDVDIDRLVLRLAGYAPDRILSKIKRVQGTHDDIPRSVAACKVFREIYNYRSRDKLKASARNAA